MAPIDFSTSAMLAGRVRGPEAKPVAGVRVELVDPSSGQVLGDAVSIPDGEYRLTLFPELDPEAFRIDDLVLRAVDARRLLLADVGGLALRPSEAFVVDLDVPADRLAEFTPVAAPHQRTAGPLLDDTALRTIEAAILGLDSVDERGRAQYLDAVHKTLPELAGSASFADDAFGVLEGDPDAAERFRRALGRYDLTPGTLDAVFGLGPDLLPREPFGTLPLPHPRNCAIPLSKFGMAAAAALIIADSTEEAFARLGQLELGFAGLRDFESMYADAIVALGGDNRRFVEALDRLGSKPFPPPSPQPPFGPLGVCEILRASCVAELVGKLKKPWLKAGGAQPSLPAGPSYTITALVPADGCPGSTVVIKGTGFGTIAGQVCFPTTSAAPRVCVNATSWTNTEVHAVVPPEAASGTLTLAILEHTIASCAGTYSVERPGTGAAFTGGASQILSLAVAGKVNKVCVEPGTLVPVTWSAAPAGAVTVRLQIAAGSSVLFDQSGLAATGSISFTTPASTTPSSFTATVTATGPCGTDARALLVHVDVVPTITVDGIEVTQGIQTFGRSGVADNSLPLAAGKDTIVRVYLSADRKGFNQNLVANVLVTLDIDGVELWPINGITPTTPNGGATLRTIGPRSAVNRSNTDSTVNFRIPAFLCGGTRQLFVYVVAGACAGNKVITVGKLQTVSWQDEPALRVRYVRITDNRPAPNGTGTTPTDDQARFTVLRAFDLLPTAPADIAPAIIATASTTRDFANPADVTGLNQLLSDIDWFHDTFEWSFSRLGLNVTPAQDQAFWILLTSPFNSGLAGRPGNTAVAAMHTVAQGQGAIQRTTPAHEIAHNLDFMHVNVLCPGLQPILGPFYSHPNSGTLLDVPFDPFYNQALAGTIQDFMSYGCRVWTSDDSWTRLLGAV